MELARIVVGIVVTIWLPDSVPTLRSNAWLRLTWTVVYSAYVIGPLLPQWKAWVLLGATVSVGLTLAIARSVRTRPVTPGLPVIKLVGALGGIVAIVVTLRGLDGFLDIISIVIKDNQTAIILSGLLFATFCANDVVRILVVRFVGLPSNLSSGAPQDALIGEHIGWIERAVVFLFIVGGQPSAAALAITAKSLARVADPKAQKEGFVEYFLIGTLASLLVALVVAIATRLTLGLSGL